MKIKLLALFVLLAGAWAAPAQTNAVSLASTNPLPTMDFLVQKVTARAVNDEDKNDNLFDMNYQYTRSRVWEYRNSKGVVVSHEEKHSVENKPERIAARKARQAGAKNPTPATTSPARRAASFAASSGGGASGLASRISVRRSVYFHSSIRRCGRPRCSNCRNASCARLRSAGRPAAAPCWRQMPTPARSRRQS